LWAITVFLVKEKRNYILTLIPSVFMTMVCTTFLLIAEKEGFGLGKTLSYSIGGIVSAAVFVLFLVWKRRFTNRSA
jgi:carbon starvation protein CstA